jgi:hypothetical protein
VKSYAASLSAGTDEVSEGTRYGSEGNTCNVAPHSSQTFSQTSVPSAIGASGAMTDSTRRLQGSLEVVVVGLGAAR